MEDLKHPDEWMRLMHPPFRIYDPDGWRGINGRDYDDLITLDEFERRLIYCTIGPQFESAR